MEYLEIYVAFFSLLFLFYYCFNKQNKNPTNWPLVGMLPALLTNRHRIHEFSREVTDNPKLTIVFRGPWFTNMNLLVTADPSNVHHVFTKHFQNYPKGSKFKEIFEVLGNGIFNSDSDLWQYQRKMAQGFLAHPQFHKFLVNKICEKVELGLIPILDQASKHGLEIDLQDLFGRMTFDTIFSIIMNHDPKTLSMDLPKIPSCKAIEDIEEAILYRHVVPSFVWKLQRWLRIGHERKYLEGWKILDDLTYACISKKWEEMYTMPPPKEGSMRNEIGVDLITFYMNEVMQSKLIEHNNRDKFLRDTFLTFLTAGRDTTSVTLSWFFYLISTNPRIWSNIKEELDEVMSHVDIKHEHDKLVYLHAALCETLRLYPPVAFEAKVPIESEILPSGHKVNSNMQIIFCLYAMGRMKSIWGEDCCEFKPERWISEKGILRHEPSYKFFAFNTGPRTCLGKNMAFTQMKIVAAQIISKYCIQPVDGHLVVPDVSFVLHMKHGFKVKVLGSQ